MQLKQAISLDKLHLLNPLVNDYLNGKEGLDHLFTYKPKIEEIANVIDAKKDFPFREILHQALEHQYADFSLSAETKNNLDALLQTSTYTVCTAHQLCLFAGPSYFIYKILSAIKLAGDLNKKYPEQTFVPVYWMGSEDHDFDEINHTHIYGKTLKWQNEDKGAVGRYSLTGFDKIIEEFEEILGTHDVAQQFIARIKNHFIHAHNYGSGFQSWILDIFRDYGLLVINQDDAQLKSCIKNIIQDELLNQSTQNALKSNEQFLAEQYHNQAAARPINLFYLKHKLRERIELEDNVWKVVGMNISFDQAKLLRELNDHPENFSPNVFLRPLYQESVLPNVAFIGGPGEVAYWLQLKDVFNHFKVVQPLILLRDMAIVLPENHFKKLAHWHISIEEMFGHYDEIAKDFVHRFSDNALNLDDERNAISEIFEKVKAKAIEVDPNMGRSAEAEQQKIFNSLANLESKLIRAEKRNYEQQLSQLENIQSKLLPNKVLQERYDNFAPVYLKNPDSYFETLLESFNPFDQALKVYQT